MPDSYSRPGSMTYEFRRVSREEAAARPPYSEESEKSVIGSLLLDNSAWDRVSSTVFPEDFYLRENRIIFEAISNLCSSGRAADFATVKEELKRLNCADDVGGWMYLTSIVNSTPAALNVRRYAEIVHELAVLRQLAEAGAEIAEMGFSPPGTDIADMISRAQALVFSIDENSARGSKGFRKIDEISQELTVEITQLVQTRSGDNVSGIPTGFRVLDSMTSGLQRGDFIVVAGRPAMGKTSFAMNIAEHVSLTQRLPVAVFSMEMGAVQLARRLMSSVAQVPAQKLRRGQVNDSEWVNITQADEAFQGCPMYIDDAPGLKVGEVRSRVRRLSRQVGPLALIVVDYLQLMSSSARASGNDNRAVEIAEISRGLKALAKEMNVPVIGLSQLNRQVDSRADKRPLMSDLRESGSIEQDADVILFIFRQAVYEKTNEQRDKSRDNDAEVIIGKQRNGPTGTVELIFNGEFTRFEDKAV